MKTFLAWLISSLVALAVIFGLTALIAWPLAAFIPLLIADPGSFWLWVVLLLILTAVRALLRLVRTVTINIREAFAEAI